MVNVTINIPESIKEKIDKDNINIALVVSRLVKQIEEERDMTDWSVKLQRTSRRGRFDELKRKGYI